MFKIILLLLFSINIFANNITDIYDFRFWQAPDHTRVVIDITKNYKYKLITKQKTIVLQIKNTKLNQIIYHKLLSYKDNRIKTTKISNFANIMQIIWRTKKKYNVKSFSLKPNKRYKYNRLVIDLADTSKKIINNNKINKKIIIIDAGHGGEDPGASGRISKEKNIVLNIAKKLQKIINHNPKLKAILSRKSDYFIKLTNRVKFAQKNNAAIFISIHADSVKRKTAKGASVYVLSAKGGNTKFAKELEKSENSTDIFGSAIYNIINDKILNNTINELSRINRKKESYKLAANILKKLGKFTYLHKKIPQKANFVVLKAPVIPSVLVEVAFISNPYEEKRLNNAKIQQKIAYGIYSGIINYLND